MTGDLNFSQLVLQQLQQQIRDMLFADPLGPVDSKHQTATEIEARQQNAVKRNAAAFTRMESELVNPIVTKSAYLLNEHGMLPDINISGQNMEFKIDNQKIGIEFASPLDAVQKEKDLRSMMTFYQSISGLFGPTAVMAVTDIAKLPQLLAEKLDIPLELVKSETEVKQILQQLQQAAQQQQQAQQQASQQQQQQGNAQTPQGAPQQ
jgi:hypothetical protein